MRLLISKYLKKDLFSYVSAFLILIVLTRFIASFFSTAYDWDIDHRIYFSQRLLNGELNYINEFDDQLPFMQYLFLLPAFFKSVKVWVLISSISVLTSAFYLFRFLRGLIYFDWGLKNKNIASKISFLSSLGFVFLLSSLDGTLVQINAIACSFSVLSIVFYLGINKEYSYHKDRNKKNYLLSVLFGAMSISVRPYYAPHILLIAIWDFHRSLSERRNKNILFPLFRWMISLIFIGTLINATPYILTGKLNDFISGIKLNGQLLHPNKPIEILYEQFNDIVFKTGNFESIIYLPFLLIIFIFIFIFLSKFYNLQFLLFKVNKIKCDLFYIGIVSPLLIELVILGKHYWNHYVQLFAGLSSISFAFLLILLMKFKSSNFEIKFFSNKLFFNLVLIITLIFLGRIELIKSTYYLSGLFKNHFQQTDLKLVQEFLNKRKDQNLTTDFLYPTGMYIHWKLNEPRHGFPNAANFLYIYDSYWENIKLGIFKKEDYSYEGFCKVLAENSPSIVFGGENSYEKSCLSNPKYERKILFIGKNNFEKLFAITRLENNK
tara:strand:+ start:433 stop:2079 length:1647 start_codon:yes stop_codon:yes gene_type:complete